MKPSSLSPCVITDKIDETKDFYMKHFGAEVFFDCGWYVDLHFGGDSATLQFMSPQTEEQVLFGGAGLTYNFAVEDVDREYKKLTDAGLPVIMPLEDHPWGDRGFSTMDPNGIALYVYTETEPNEEFRRYFK